LRPDFKYNTPYLMNLIEQIKENAKKANKTIVLPEGEEERTLKAADIVLKEGYAQTDRKLKNKLQNGD